MSTELLSLAPVLGRAPLQVFARLNVLAGGAGQPASPDSAARLQSLSQTLLATSAPALMVAALVHADLATSGPFTSRNGIVVPPNGWCWSRGVSTRPRSSYPKPVTWHCVRSTSPTRGYREGGRSGLHAWLLYAAEAQAKGAEEGSRCAPWLNSLVEPSKPPHKMSGTELPQVEFGRSRCRSTHGLGYQACIV